jgi:hypothetical protein
MIGELIVTLILVALGILVTAAVMAPFETLTWWGGWSDRQLTEDIQLIQSEQTEASGTTKPLYAVYLSGIGSVSGNELVPGEVPWLHALGERLPRCALILDVFPYSVTNNGLTGQRLMAGIFRWVSRRRMKKSTFTQMLINIRNVFQVGVSADQRYGPVFNFATARVIRDSLVRHGYRIGSGQRVTLIGYSGGAQIAVGVTPYLKAMTGAPIRVISIGGVLTSDPGIRLVEHFYHLYGDVDPLEKFGSIIFPSRWPIFPNSAWNTAIRQGRASLVLLSGMTHTDAGSYMDQNAKRPDGRTNLETTVALVAELVETGSAVSRLTAAQLDDIVAHVAERNPASADDLIAVLAERGIGVRPKHSTMAHRLIAPASDGEAPDQSKPATRGNS